MTDGAGGGDSAFSRSLDDLGRAIVSGELPAGHRGSVEDLTVRTGASRSVIREVVRVLGSLGMLEARRRVGLTVLPRESWDVLDPLVVRWRLTGPERHAAITELRALRRAVEPAAAAEAARRTGAGTGASGLSALLDCADVLCAAKEGSDLAAADRAFHAQVLSLSGNTLFARLGRVIDEVLEDRAESSPDPTDLEMHRELAVAISRGDGESARAAMRDIIDRT